VGIKAVRKNIDEIEPKQVIQNQLERSSTKPKINK
jgi:hypothetical protein